jgi:SAM-dependent methyltransferase
MTTEFGADYADSYDILYRTKDYAAEVDLIERLLARHGVVGPRRILDLGCGTGSHTFPLAERGHHATGVDRSPDMLARARAKAACAALPPDRSPVFLEGDIGRLDRGARFDVVLMMFMVLGYQHETAALMSALATVRRHLHANGLFIFDVWNGLAVLADPPRERVVEATHGTTHIVRRTRPQLDVIRQLCRIRFDLARTDGDDTKTWQEEHVMRYFFPQELDLALRCHDLDLVELSSFPDGKGPPDDRAWNIVGMARAR